MKQNGSGSIAVQQWMQDNLFLGKPLGQYLRGLITPFNVITALIIMIGIPLIVMRYFLDMSMSEMSTETGRPLSTIKWWLRDGRKRLRGLMDARQGR